MSDYDKLFETVRKNLGDDERFEEKLEWIDSMVSQYAEKLGATKYEVLRSFESARSYWAANYYQPANQPDINDVRVFDNIEDFKAVNVGGFVCPKCGKTTRDPLVCKECGWSAGGLFGALGKGIEVIFKKNFLSGEVGVVKMFRPANENPELNKIVCSKTPKDQNERRIKNESQL